jgi:cell division protein FtsB
MDSELKMAANRSGKLNETRANPSAHHVGTGQRMDEKVIAFAKRHMRALLVLAVAVLLVHDVFGTHGFIAMRRTARDIKKVQADLDHLNKENLELEQQVRDLKTDPHTIERLAREGSLLARPGEVIIKIPQTRVDQTSAKSKP